MISKLLEVSTVHLHPDLDCELKENPDLRRQLGVESLDYGWLVRIPVDEQLPHLGNLELSENYNLLVSYARTRGISFIILDPDAPAIDLLPSYEWD